MGRGGVGVRVRVRIVSKGVLWAFFEISLLITLEPHVGHTKFSDFLYFILDSSPFVR